MPLPSDTRAEPRLQANSATATAITTTTTVASITSAASTASVAPTDYVLLKCHWPVSVDFPASAASFASTASITTVAAAELADAAQQWCAIQSWHLYRVAWAPGASPNLPTAWIYARLPSRTQLQAGALTMPAQAWRHICPAAQDTTLSRLERVLDQPGCSQGEPAVFHYAVETDPETGWADEIFRWYDTEHMPGLAQVPGCIHARRLLNHDHGVHQGLDHGPLSLACYDLRTQETLGSPAWLAVRGTAWSSITRPHFSNTRRTMLQVAG